MLPLLAVRSLRNRYDFAYWRIPIARPISWSKEIRDSVVEQMRLWVLRLENPQSLEDAKELTRHLPEIRQLVGEELKKRGITYSYTVELGVVPFPTKLYGGTVYPAGDYDAARITLGEGQGQNWWCVLFPPLCFIDGGAGMRRRDC